MDDQATGNSLRELVKTAKLLARSFGSKKEFIEFDLQAQVACLSGKCFVRWTARSPFSPQAFFRSLFAVSLLTLSCGLQPSLAQAEKASVSGRVTDQNNAALPNAQVQIRNTETKIVTSVRTNGEGIYVISSLNPGNYIMNVNKQGFRPVSVTGVTLNVQQKLSRNFVLRRDHHLRRNS